MAAADDFARITAALAEVAPVDADIGSIELGQDDGGHRVVLVHTRTIGRLIGHGGVTADAVRTAMAERLGDRELRLSILEMPPG